jgi:hypothetical protein
MRLQVALVLLVDVTVLVGGAVVMGAAVVVVAVWLGEGEGREEARDEEGLHRIEVLGCCVKVFRMVFFACDHKMRGSSCLDSPLQARLSVAVVLRNVEGYILFNRSVGYGAAKTAWSRRNSEYSFRPLMQILALSCYLLARSPSSVYSFAGFSNLYLFLKGAGGTGVWLV